MIKGRFVKLLIFEQRVSPNISIRSTHYTQVYPPILYFYYYYCYCSVVHTLKHYYTVVVAHLSAIVLGGLYCKYALLYIIYPRLLFTRENRSFGILLSPRLLVSTAKKIKKKSTELVSGLLLGDTGSCATGWRVVGGRTVRALIYFFFYPLITRRQYEQSTTIIPKIDIYTSQQTRSDALLYHAIRSHSDGSLW